MVLVTDRLPKIGALVYTYDRVDDARINLEIIRLTWSRTSLLRDVVLVHAFNGSDSWWPSRYLEDELVYVHNPGHFAGAALLIDIGIGVFIDKHREIDYVVILAADTWCTKPEFLDRIISEMLTERKVLATCAWGTKELTDMFHVGMAVDCFIIDLQWAITFNLFPIGYAEFCADFENKSRFQLQYSNLEHVFAVRFRQAEERLVGNDSGTNNAASSRERLIRRIREREPIHLRSADYTWHRQMRWPSIGLTTDHDPYVKREFWRPSADVLGEYGQRFLKTRDLSYYNRAGG